MQDLDGAVDVFDSNDLRLQGLSPTSGPSDVPTLQLGIGSLAAGYFLKERRKVTTGKPFPAIAWQTPAKKSIRHWEMVAGLI